VLRQCYDLTQQEN